MKLLSEVGKNDEMKNKNKIFDFHNEQYGETSKEKDFS